MAVVNKIKAQAYCDHFERASDNIYAVKKNRPFDIHGVYKATEAYEVELTLDDVIDNDKFYIRKYLTTTDVVEFLIEKGVLPFTKYGIMGEDRHWDYVNDTGFLPKTPPHIRTNSTKLIVFNIDEFERCKPTKKEQETILCVENRKKMQNLNNLVVTENIAKILKDKKYDIRVINGNDASYDAFHFDNKRAFNVLVKDALEYYLNNIVLKDLGCTITVPKQKSSHCYGHNDVLCYIGDIKLDK